MLRLPTNAAGGDEVHLRAGGSTHGDPNLPCRCQDGRTARGFPCLSLGLHQHRSHSRRVTSVVVSLLHSLRLNSFSAAMGSMGAVFPSMALQMSATASFKRSRSASVDVRLLAMEPATQRRDQQLERKHPRSLTLSPLIQLWDTTGPSAPSPGRAGVAHLGSSEIGYSFRVGVCWAPDRAALPLQFSVIFEYGGLIP